MRWEAVIFTDLDGTLLDEETYGWSEAGQALGLCKELDIPVVAVSSKTRAEILPLLKEIGLKGPFVSENGGGVFFPKDSFRSRPVHLATEEEGLWRWSLGADYKVVVHALKAIKEELGWDLLGFSEMGPGRIAGLTGLSPEKALLAAQREYDEPFIILSPSDPELELLHGAARKRGLSVTAGGRFYHLKGDFDKGAAVEGLINWYALSAGRRPYTVGLGDGENDLPMLSRVDWPVLIKGKRQLVLPPDLQGRIRLSIEPGPRGWNQAVMEFLLSCRGGNPL